MQIEAGKSYRTRDGRKVGPMVRRGPQYSHAPWLCEDEIWLANGEYGSPNHPLDLIAEWTEGPVRTVTRREIVPGRYGYIQVSHSPIQEGVTVQFVAGPSPILIASELRAAAATFLELAEALEDVG